MAYTGLANILEWIQITTEIPLYPAITLLADRCTRIATLLKF